MSPRWRARRRWRNRGNSGDLSVVANDVPADPYPGDSRSLLSYANLTGRPPGRLMSTAARFSRGVAQVQAEIGPYAAAWHKANVQALAGSAPRWVVFGDSMTVSVGASEPFAGWVGQAQRALAADGVQVDVVNLAAYGARAEDVIEQQIPAWRGLPTAPAGEVVSLLIGANDLMKRSWRAQLPDTFERLLAQLPDGAVVATLPQPRESAQAANAHITAAARAGRIRVVDMRRSGPQSWRGRLAPDHFHPNDTGYASIAAAFEPPLREALADLPAHER